MPKPTLALSDLPKADPAELLAAHQAGLTLVEYRQRKSCGISIPADDGAEDRLEKAEQLEVRKVFRAFGGRVYWLSQARASKQDPGLGDLFVVFEGLASFWWETKRQQGGRVSPAQREFHELCNGTATGSKHHIGGRKEAEALVIALGMAERTEDGTLEPTRRTSHA